VPELEIFVLISNSENMCGNGSQLYIEYAEIEAKNCNLVPEYTWANVVYLFGFTHNILFVSVILRNQYDKIKEDEFTVDTM
jgi:hypothetical protein